jgi:hypothetical protein
MIRPAKIPTILLLSCAVMLAHVARVEAAERTIDVGVARVDITPSYPVRMTGYGNRKTESEGVEQRLWAKAIAIGSDEQGPAVLITVDNLGVPASMGEDVLARLAKKTRLSAERLNICSSHTHCAPCLTNVAPLIFGSELPSPEQERVDRYTRELADHLEQVALAALADRRPGLLTWSEGHVGFAVNRRNLKNGHWSGFGVVSAGPTDQSMPMLRVSEPDGKLRAVLVNYACHCTTLGGNYNKICGDWAGYAQEIIERENPGATALVAIGCGADANPYPRNELSNAVQNGADIAREVKRLLALPMIPIGGPVVARRQCIELPFDTLPTRDEWIERAKQKGPIAYHAKVQLARLDRGEKLPMTLPYCIQTWQFGDELAMVFLPGEVVVDYALRLKREFSGKHLWVTAYANDDPCYIASKRVLAEGGYEVDSSMYYYDRPTHFAPPVEDLIIDTVRGLLPDQFSPATK